MPEIFKILAYGGFKCIRINLADFGITLNVTLRNEHVPKVEIYIRIIKERVRDIVSICLSRSIHQG